MRIGSKFGIAAGEGDRNLARARVLRLVSALGARRHGKPSRSSVST